MNLTSLTAAHWPEVQAIYAQGIATGNATFATSVPPWEEWDASHLPHSRLVAVADDETVLGWAALVTAALLALSVLAVAQQLISADAFGVIAIAAAIVSVGLLAVSAYNVLRTVRGSRR